MTDKNNEVRKSGDPADTDASLQNELSREAKEGADSIGDVASNRTLSGSSSWETLPDDAAADASKPGNFGKSSTPSKKKE